MSLGAAVASPFFEWTRSHVAVSRETFNSYAICPVKSPPAWSSTAFLINSSIVFILNSPDMILLIFLCIYQVVLKFGEFLLSVFDLLQQPCHIFAQVFHCAY